MSNQNGGDQNATGKDLFETVEQINRLCSIRADIDRQLANAEDAKDEKEIIRLEAEYKQLGKDINRLTLALEE